MTVSPKLGFCIRSALKVLIEEVVENFHSQTHYASSSIIMVTHTQMVFLINISVYLRSVNYRIAKWKYYTGLQRVTGFSKSLYDAQIGKQLRVNVSVTEPMKQTFPCVITSPP
eukprot:NODE_26_length_35450_cov_0.398320.p26 type:complete len:113 gc:universal NODE_26_length_35450_cov_0.398320:22155-21817(-)